MENWTFGMMAILRSRCSPPLTFRSLLRLALRDSRTLGRSHLDDAQRAPIVEALKGTEHNIAETALRVGIAKATLYRKMSA